VVVASGLPIIGAAPPPAALVGKRFVIDGTMVVGGQTVTLEIQAAPVGGGAYALNLSQLAPQAPVYVTFSFGATVPALVDNTITFSGPTVGGIFSNFGSFSTISSATLTLTVASPTVGGTVTGNATFTSTAGSGSGTITGTLTSIQ
jgi:hypothetical protein